MRSRSLPFAILLTFLFGAADAPAAAEAYRVGVAQVDITPEHPVRLNGFGFRRTESEGVTQRIHAKALAIEDADGQLAVLIAVDILGIPDSVTREVARRLEKKAGLRPERLAITATHTHTAPMLSGANPTLFGVPIPKEHLANIDRYTAVFLDRLEKVALDALADRRPARLTWGVGQIGFAINRRTRGGPVDRDLPLLLVRDLEGKVRAVYVSYACHCVTLSHNKISGDWAGYAQEAIQDAFPGAVALVSIGCGADANPSSGVSGDKVEVAQRQGAEIAAEVKRLSKTYLAPVAGKLTAAVQTIELPLADLPTREQWQERAKRNDAVGHHARVQLEKLDRKEALPTKIAYPVQTWAFGDALAMVFLPGEVVVDYSLRLKRELDCRRLWVNAYANDAPCYIPSERVLKEGGYEGGGAMIYYDVPAPFRPGLEQPIIDAVKRQLAPTFAATFDAGKTQGSRPLSPQQSQATIRVKPGFAVDLVAAEPLVVDPVAIDFGSDGRLWVAEMIDYPQGKTGKYEPGGRVRVLEDTDGDGVFDKATIFLDHLPFPTGLTVWRKGVLVCAAPDILYAEDTDGDGKADVVKKLFSGFGTDNYQARVNSLCYGLDGWVHGSCGLFGGTIKSFNGKEYALGNRDFRIRPDTGELEPAVGRTQQGRVRDDWGNWFGCDNTHLLWHYPLADHYLRRNPHAFYPAAVVNVPAGPDPNRLYPVKADAQRFKLSGPANYTTAACGVAIYRDDLLGPEYRGNAFTCEPVNLLLHRLRLEPQQSTFAGRRADDEKQAEFLAATDNWFRPVQARTGPDGALWVVDMYRFVIEHPRWIPPEDLAHLDLRAGQGMGRIYRVRPAEKPPRPWPRLDKMDAAGLMAALDSPNGPQRDMATQLLLWDPQPSAAAALEKAARSPRPETRLHALCVLDGWGRLSPQLVLAALGDAHPGVRRHAIRLAEKYLKKEPALGPAIVKRIKDADAQVRLQAACTLGAWEDDRAAKALAALAVRQADDPFLVAAVLSSVHEKNLAAVLSEVLGAAEGKGPPASLARQLFALAGTMGDGRALGPALAAVTKAQDGKFAAWQLAAAAGILDALDRRGLAVAKLPEEQARAMQGMYAACRRLAADDKAAEEERIAALPLLAREAARRGDDLALLARLLAPTAPPALRSAAVARMGRINDDRVPGLLLQGWKGYVPALKEQVLDALLSRDAWGSKLLDALAAKEVPPGEIDARRRQRLLNHKNEALRSRAAQLFDGAADANRQRVLQDYQEALKLAGDRARGKAVFVRACAACHQLDGAGHAVGPDLAALTNRTPQYLLQEIFDPNRNVDSRYVEYTAATKAGRTFTGLLAAETATTIILRGQQGKEETILRSELEELSSSSKSLMPEGLEKDLSKQDTADLLAYLTAPRPRP
jgi:putative membrane-bound dehydrogenase-like protein